MANVRTNVVFSVPNLEIETAGIKKKRGREGGRGARKEQGKESKEGRKRKERKEKREEKKRRKQTLFASKDKLQPSPTIYFTPKYIQTYNLLSLSL